MSHPPSSPRRLVRVLNGLIGVALLVALVGVLRYRAALDAAVDAPPAAAPGPVNRGAAPSPAPVPAPSAPKRAGALKPDELERELRARIAESAPFDASTAPFARPGEDVRRLLQVVTAADPALALRLVESAASDATMRYEMAAIVARAWSASDATAAWRWAETTGARWKVPERPPLLASVCEGVAGLQPHALLALAGETLRNAANASYGFDVARTVVTALLDNHDTADAQGAVEQWARELPPGSTGELVSVVARALANESGSAAAAWVAGLPDPGARPAAFAAVAATWAGSDPTAALNWASTLPAAEGRDQAIETAFQGWQHQDSAGAIAWLARHAATTPTDALLAGVVSAPSFRAENPEAAVELSSLIRDAEKRAPLLRAALLSWATRDHDAALRYLSTSPMTPAEKAKILAALDEYSDFGFH